MSDLIFRGIARFISRRPRLILWLERRGRQRPYRHIVSRDGSCIYMNRFWLFNPYENPDGTPVSRNWLMRRLPSVRLHHIVRPDDAGPLHDHPWNARTLILQGCYVEYYENPDFDPMLVEHAGNLPIAARLMSTGDSRVIRYGEFHRIARVSVNPPLLTLFLTYGYRGPWGFKVDGKKVHWRKYLGLRV